MVKINYLNIVAVSALTFMLSACTPALQPTPAEVIKPEVVTEPRPVVQHEKNVDLSQKSQSFHNGMHDGCATAKGKYTKDAEHFRQEADYGEGWFYGRRKCQAH